jgi:hypothetical protein
VLRAVGFLFFAWACLVAPDRHAELQRASRVAMTCPDIAPGEYVVEVVLGDGPASARVVSSPAVGASTVRCIALAFATQRYAPTRGTTTLRHAFVLLDGGP